ncbi:hypothetical protein IWX49DRAFT_389100 [Phyllosticta citricarpa]
MASRHLKPAHARSCRRTPLRFRLLLRLLPTFLHPFLRALAPDDLCHHFCSSGTPQHSLAPAMVLSSIPFPETGFALISMLGSSLHDSQSTFIRRLCSCHAVDASFLCPFPIPLVVGTLSMLAESWGESTGRGQIAQWDKQWHREVAGLSNTHGGIGKGSRFDFVMA